VNRVQLCLATRNPHKTQEIAALLQDLPGLEVEIRSVPDFPGCPDVAEDAPTLEGNAEKKARVVCGFTGWLTLADDTGLEVDALGGAPGVYSARYAGPGCDFAANVRKLLDEMRAVPDERRTAHFRCVMALATPLERTPPAKRSCRIEPFTGIVRGVIGREPRGTGGFGYDPVFYLPDQGCTLAELSLQWKNACSHRGLAAVQVARELVVRYGAPRPDR
jgi:XTP/dITP diphosphohydrolase